MDNASKALVLAGGTLIGVLIISICMYLYTAFKTAYSDNLLIHDALEIATFNSFFSSFPEEVKGWEAYNIVGKIKDINADEDALTVIDLDGDISLDNYQTTTFYFTEALTNNKYQYSYQDTNKDGLYDYVELIKID